MRPRLEINFNARRLAVAFALAFALAVAIACDLDGASKKNAMSKTETPSGSKPPRTNLPMPPVAASHGGDAEPASAAPAGAWTQLDGRRSTLEDLRGQVVVLDFWATYCPPCREEIPHLVRLQKQFGPQGLKVIGLNVGGDEDRPKVPEFVKEYKIQYQLADPEDETIRRFLLTDDIPQTFVIDRQGRVVGHVVGFDGEVAEQLERAITTALATKAD